jgi:hypothetical protein
VATRKMRTHWRRIGRGEKERKEARNIVISVNAPTPITRIARKNGWKEWRAGVFYVKPKAQTRALMRRRLPTKELKHTRIGTTCSERTMYMMLKHNTTTIAVAERMEDFKNQAPISLARGNFVKRSIRRRKTLLSR